MSLHALCFHANVSLPRHTPQWPAPRRFGLAGALEAAMTVAQKEPFLVDASLASHRFRLWRGGPSSNPCVEVVPMFSLLADGGWRFVGGCVKLCSLGFTKKHDAISLVRDIHCNYGLLDRGPSS